MDRRSHSGSQYPNGPPLGGQLYDNDNTYVQMYPVASSATKVPYADIPPALPPKPQTSATNTTTYPYGQGIPQPMYPPMDERPPPYAPSLPEPSYTGASTWSSPSPPNMWSNRGVDNSSLELQQYRRENIHLQAEIDQLKQQLRQLEQNSYPGGGGNGWLTQQNEDLHRQVAQLTQENSALKRESLAAQSEVTVLQHSLRAHKEDFEQERHDRVRIHEEKEKLKMELESQSQVIKMLTEEHGGTRLMEIEQKLGNDEREQCQRCHRMLPVEELVEHMQKCVQ